MDDSDFTLFHSLFNDFYAGDASKKIPAIMRAKGNTRREGYAGLSLPRVCGKHTGITGWTVNPKTYFKSNKLKKWCVSMSRTSRQPHGREKAGQHSNLPCCPA
jgi:hypothetical protein